jgi:hypothetical protein
MMESESVKRLFVKLFSVVRVKISSQKSFLAELEPLLIRGILL